MENKLQELTDKLYREGLSKGKEEGEALLAKAETKAAEIIETAQQTIAPRLKAMSRWLPYKASRPRKRT